MTSLYGDVFRITDLFRGTTVSGEFPYKWSIMRSFDVFFDISLEQPFQMPVT